MINRDSRCVFVADSMAQAEVVANWLRGQGIETDIPDRNTLGGLDGLNWLTGIGARGLEIWVKDPDRAESARRLLDDFSPPGRAEAEGQTQPVEAVCEECGKSATFPATALGTVQDCPHCGAYMDVPDPQAPGDESETDDAEGQPESMS